MKPLVILSVTLVMFISVTGLKALGTTANTVISNAKTQGPLSSLLTNAGTISARFTNVSGTTSYCMVMGTIATTHISVGHDLSLIPGTNGSATGLAGNFADFSWTVTNHGNWMDNIRFRMTNRAAAVGWQPPYNAFEIITNGSIASGPAQFIDWTYSNLPANSTIQVILRVFIPAAMADGSTNRFMSWVDDNTAGAGDSWPGANAIAPAIPDTLNLRDHQWSHLVVRVSGPIILISKIVFPLSAVPYDYLTYTIHYTNAGTANAMGVIIQDFLPVHMTNMTNLRIFTNNSAVSQSLTSAPGDDDGEIIGRKLIVRPHLGVLPAGNFGNIRFRAQVK
jgi:uncharacterized repeat protein (TIGR01451 family)